MHVVYNNRKVHQARKDSFFIRVESETKSPMGIIEREPVDLTGWTFTLYLHRKIEYHPHNLIYQTEGEVYGANGVVAFTIPAEELDIKPDTYWYTIEYTRPNGKVVRGVSAKYIVADTLSDYFSIYK